MKHFEWSSRSASSAKTIAKEVFLPLAGILGITALLVAILYACIEFGKGLPPVVPVHIDDGETVDPNPYRFAFMLIGFALSFVLAAISEHKGRQGRTYPAFWWGYAGGTLLWQSVGECSWHFSIKNEDYLMCFPHLEGASALFLVLMVSVILIYCYEKNSFGWGMWVFLLSFIGNWFGHFIQIGSYPLVSKLIEESSWFQLTGAIVGSLTCVAAILLGVFSARDTKARLCTSLMLYFGLGIIVTGVAGL